MLDRCKLWIKANKLTAGLVVVVIYLLARSTGSSAMPLSLRTISTANYDESSAYVGSSMSKSADYMAQDSYSPMPPVGGESVIPASGSRMVSRDANMSIVVQKVLEAQKQMIAQAEAVGGFMVSSSTSSPGETATGNFVVRVPSKSLDAVMDGYRKLGVKVASESVSGNDITDQYTDITARLAPLQDTYAQFEQLRKEAKTIEEKMNVLSYLQNLQNQIDSLMGQQKYLDGLASTSRISVYLSTDEYELPYAPDDGGWRPAVIFKQSVRDLVRTLRGYGAWAINAAVYSVIWIPLLIIGYLIYRRFLRPKQV